ncbi:hypothetical protein BJX99DRAFT_238923 [Aspergillus californicus]
MPHVFHILGFNIPTLATTALFMIFSCFLYSKDRSKRSSSFVASRPMFVLLFATVQTDFP